MDWFKSLTVKCWGRGSDGQLGDGAMTSSVTPVSVSGISNATAISSGRYHTCALLSDNTVKCWGYNLDDQITPPEGLKVYIPEDEEKEEAGTTEVDDEEADEVSKTEPVVFVVGSAPRFLPRRFISLSSDIFYATRQDEWE